MKLTIKTIGQIEPSNKELYFWDDDLPGYGLRVMPSGVKSFMVQYRNASGNSRRLTIGRFGVLTPEEARRLAKEKLADVIKGFDPVEAQMEQLKAMTVKQLCEDYIAASEKGLILGKRGKPKKISSMYEDKSRIKRHIIPLLGQRKVRDLTAPDIYRFMRDVTAGKTALDERTTKRGRAIVTGGSGIAARSVSTLGGMMTYAIQEGIITHSPTRGVKKPKGKNRYIRLNEEQYGKLGEAITAGFDKGWHQEALKAIQLIALTGCRKGEIELLRWAEVDFAKRCLRLEDTKEGASIRPLGKAAIDLLKTLPQEDDYVFHGRGENKLLQATPKIFQQVRNLSSDLPADLTLHGLRHAFASTAADLGYADSTIAAMLGHSLHSITGRYIHHLDSVLLAATDRVAGYIQNSMNGSAEILNIARFHSNYS